ncbi:leiomodin-2-like [Solea senegalensis]|uniref:Leiomodin-3 n=1 Tax=Solea senegalensis TaxID=28829 RepID=A0AAV6SY51_SOLSE|nr:leiomodin-2a [Solea senegalensis]KAG7522120.1 leiomodin-2-like [Solea senegalensis]
MSTFGYCRELKKYEEVDEDELLATLSSQELQELERELADLDPDDNVPIGLRQKDQTTKTPTGTFDRDALLKYCEDENKKLPEDETEESKERQEGRPDTSGAERVSATSSNTGKTLDNDRKKASNKDKKTQRASGKNETTLKELEKKDGHKKEAPSNRSKCSQKNGLSKGLKGELRTETTDQNPDTTSERPSGNPIVIDTVLEQILGDDPTVNDVNLNNIEDVSQETLLRFAEALSTNTHVHVFSLANTRADDRVAFAISKMLCENCSIRNLNIESNFVSGRGILALLAALKHNKTLVELRFHNQRHICGGKVEMEMVQLLRENTTLLKLGYQFDLPGPRMTATSILTRNQDQQRQRRLQEKQQQGPPEVSGQVSSPSAEKRTSKKLSLSSKTAEKKKNINSLPAPLEPPSQKITEMAKQREASNTTKGQWNQKKPKTKKLKNGANEKESADILKDLRNALKPSGHKRQAEPSHLPPPQRSSRDDLMAAIRGSSIQALKRVDLPQTEGTH